MKNGIFEKARRRAIKLLGGYTEPLVMPQPVVKKYEKVPLRLSSVCVYPKSMLMPTVKENAKYRLAGELAKQIIEQKLCAWREEEGYDPSMAHYVMTVEILPPVDGW